MKSRFQGDKVLHIIKHDGLNTLFLIDRINAYLLTDNPPKITIGKKYFTSFVKTYLHESKVTKDELRNCLTKTITGSYKFNIKMFKDYHTYN